jgi:dynein heavy chain
MWSDLESRVSHMSQLLPLLVDMQASPLRARHWGELLRLGGKDALNVKWTPVDTSPDSAELSTPVLSFLDILSLQWWFHVDDVVEIRERAVKEAKVEKKLKEIEDLWGVSFDSVAVASSLNSKVTSGRPKGASTVSTSRPTTSSSRVAGTVSSGFDASHAIEPPRVVNPNSGLCFEYVNHSNPASKFENGDIIKVLRVSDLVYESLEAHQVELQAISAA